MFTFEKECEQWEASDRIVALEEENNELKMALNSAKVVMRYYDKNKGIHPMLNDFATEWLEING